MTSTWQSCYAYPDDGAYEGMVQEENRALQFEVAIKQRLKGRSGMVVVDIGTGPFALLALIAARAGAERVYAIEANPDAARSARSCVALARDVKPGCITILEGLSTSIELAEKADLLVAELVGSVASEEALITTMRDAQSRFMKRPNESSSYIPTRITTLAAPASFALHYILAQLDWFDGLNGEPVRVECSDAALQLLAPPQVVEDFRFGGGPGAQLPGPGTIYAASGEQRVVFEIDAGCVEGAEASHIATLSRERVARADAAPLARAIAHSLSGLAMWPRLQLDEAGEIMLETRGARGARTAPHTTHWQTVLPLLSPRPIDVDVGDVLRVALEISLPQAVDEPSEYTVRGELLRGAHESGEGMDEAEVVAAV